MTKEMKHLETKIRTFEDKVLRNRDPQEQDLILEEIRKMRMNLQRMQFKEMNP